MTQALLYKRSFLLFFLMVLLSGCVTTHPHGVEDHNISAKTSVDPYEGFNRKVEGFNYRIDRYFLRPIAQGYRFVTPDFFEHRISSFFANLSEIGSVINALLQGKGEKAADHTGRFLVNSTIGLAGLFDAASEIGMEKIDGEDFGQTLGAWGVDSGPFLMLPFLGPSTVRDGLGLPVDAYTNPINYAEESSTRMGLNFLDIVDTRASLLDSERLLSGDRYIFIRDAYLQRREYLINDGDVEDTFGRDINGDF